MELNSHGREPGPALAVEDGALGFWKALRHVSGPARWQRYWAHKTANGLDQLPQDLQPQAQQRLQALWMAPDRARAELALDLFMATYEAKYPKAAECLAQDREVLLALYDFTAEPWGHLRTTKPIASTFATVRARTEKTCGDLSRVTMLAMVCTLYQSAAKRWHRLRAGHDLQGWASGRTRRRVSPLYSNSRSISKSYTTYVGRLFRRHFAPHVSRLTPPAQRESKRGASPRSFGSP